MRKFGLIGKSLKHSFSQDYFNSFFKKECITDAEYNLYEISNISELPKLLDKEKDILGFNVTMPYKEAIIPYLNHSDDIVKEIGACNCVKIVDGELYGYNTDVHGFMLSIIPLIEPQHHKAIILGNGGASKAVIYALEQMSIDFKVVARNPKTDKEIKWESLINKDFIDTNIVINTTPIGMYPNVNEFPQIPYEVFSRFHLVYDLIYNPPETQFLIKAKEYDTVTKNGFEMLNIQANKAWEIWNAN